jgi:Tfp pilus assembly protein PilF
VAAVPAGLGDRRRRSRAEVLAAAQRYLDQDRPFAAHEVLEEAWKSGPEVERDAWQGLAQLAVALTHRQRGNEAGAAALLERAEGHLVAGGFAGARALVAAARAGARVRLDPGAER